MSFLFGGRPQLSSAEKIAAAETEIEMVSDMFNRFALFSRQGSLYIKLISFIASPSPVQRSVYRPTTAKEILTKGNLCAWIDAYQSFLKSI